MYDETNSNIATGRWIAIRPLGQGSFGTVTLVRNVDNGMYAAMKEVPITEATAVMREFSVMCSLPPHPHVVRILGAAARGKKARLFMEYCPNGALNDVLKANEPQPEPYVRSCVRQILDGLAFLHRHQVLHRDIKPANILIDSSGVLKIADFGISRQIDSVNTQTMGAGSPAYMSPEAVRGQLCTGSDLWAVGATMSEMLTGQLPWSHTDAFRAGREPLLLYIGTHPNDHPAIPTTATPEAQDFMRRVFDPDPKKRGTAADLLQHSFFTSYGPQTPLSQNPSSNGSHERSGPPRRGDVIDLDRVVDDTLRDDLCVSTGREYDLTVSTRGDDVTDTLQTDPGATF
jgi:serine/threonine protein kinase